MKGVRFAIWFATMIVAAGRIVAAEVPVAVQLPLFVNVWRMDRNFAHNDHVTIAILYEGTNAMSTATKDAVLVWARDKPTMRLAAVAMDDPNAFTTLQGIEADVFYLTPMRAADVERIAAIARPRQIRTMTGVRQYLLLGASVAIGVRDDRPHIIINLEAAKAEGAVYPAQLLQLAEIVKGH